MIFNNIDHLQQPAPIFVPALFQAPYTNEWKENKRFAVQTLKNTGFGTQRAEEKINNQITILMKYLENQNGAAFDPKTPLQNTAASIMTSILLNSSPTWGSKELERYKKVSEGVLNSLATAFNLHVINMFVPKLLMQLIWGDTMKECMAGADNIRAFAWEHIKEHRDTYDPDFTRDFLDIYQKEGRDKTMEEKVFVNTIVDLDLLPDGAGRTTEAINWIVIYLAYHPEVQNIAQKQLDEVIHTKVSHINKDIQIYSEFHKSSSKVTQ